LKLSFVKQDAAINPISPNPKLGLFNFGVLAQLCCFDVKAVPSSSDSPEFGFLGIDRHGFAKH